MAEKTLADTVAELEDKLEQPGGEDENLGKALDVAALALGGDVKPKGRGKKKVVDDKPVVDEKEAQDTKTEQLLKSLLEEDDEPSLKVDDKRLGKSIVLPDGRTAVDASDIVISMDAKLDALAVQLDKGGLPKKMLRKAITAIVESQQTSLDEELGQLKKGMSVLCKAMKFVMDHIDAMDAAPVGGSRFDAMAKSVAVLRTQITADGGTPFPLTATNKEILAKARMTNVINDATFQVIKKTGMLPAGVNLSPVN